MLSDLPYLYLFWITLFVLGAINLPLTFLVFNKFVDRGYIFSKIIGLVLISFSVWLFSLLKILPFAKTSIFLLAVFWLIVNLIVYKKTERNINLSKNPKILTLFLFEEILFISFFALWSYIRGFAPDIHGLEKFMDFGFINSILRTRFMPPLDMWLAPSPDYPYHFINYYYFGHFVTALLTKISLVPAEVSYNLMLGVICGFTFSGVFSITLNLFALFQKQQKMLGEFFYNRRTIICGLMAGFLVTFGGNLHTIYAFTKGYSLEQPKPVWEVLGRPNPNSYWYPNATRFIKNTIHEFPSYSFIVSDLHGHVLDIPFVLLTIAFLFSIFISVKSDNFPKFKIQNSKFKMTTQTLKFFIFNFYFLILLGLLLAVMYMTNAWDGIIYLCLSGLVLLVVNTHFTTRNITHRRIKNQELRIKNLKIKTANVEISINLIPLLLASCFLLLSFIFFSFPFNRNFIPFAKGIGINCITPNANNQVLCDHSPIWMLVILWGYFYYFSISFLLFTVIPAIKSFLNNYSYNSGFRIQDSGLQFKIKNFSEQNLTLSDIFVILLILISTLLLIAPEFIFARDIYPAHYRANTMFKLGYQAFIMLGIVVAYVSFRFRAISPFTNKVVGWFWRKLAYVQIFLVSIYILFGINSYYSGLKQYKTLNGVEWMRQFYPSDLQVIKYFKKNLGEFEQPVVLEAVGESYTDYARISAYTGLPTVVGWPVHEWLWRGSYNEAGKRQEEVRKMYESENLSEVADLIRKYEVKYAVISTLEQQKYSRLNEANFQALGKIVFQSGATKIYQINI